MRTKTQRLFTLCAAACGLASAALPARAEDWPMWGRTPQRNMVSPEKNAPTEWDVSSGVNIKWTAQLGSQSYGNVTVANGLAFAGSNNEGMYDKAYNKDAGVLLGFDEKTGKFLWQNLSPKLAAGRVNDWPFQGICSSPLLENNLLWYTTSRCETIAFDMSPLQAGDKPKQVWKSDMMGQLGVFPHNMTSCSPLSYGDYIYVITGNGVDEGHKNVPAPTAPAIVCFDKHNGKVVWAKNPPGDNILHGQWSSPALAEVNGRTQLIAPLGDGWVYAFDAKTGDIIWKFDSNNKNTIYPTTRNELISTPVVVGDRMYIANGQDPEHGEGIGHLWCIDITKEGDISKEIDAGEDVAANEKAGGELLRPAGGAKKGKPNPNTGVVWDYEKFDINNDGKIRGNERMNRTISTVCVYNGLVFAPDFSGFFHCLDAKTGKHLWTYDMQSAMWGSPLAVDGKIYLGDENGDLAIFEAKADVKEPIAKIDMGSSVYASPIFANGVLYVMAKDRLYAIQTGANSPGNANVNAGEGAGATGNGNGGGADANK